MIKAIDVHAHPSTRAAAQSMLKYQKALMQYYQKRKMTDEEVLSMSKSEDDMAQDFVDANVRGIIVAWDAESNTGEPATSNDYIAKLTSDHPEAYIGGFASVDPWKGEMAIKEADRSIKELGLMGVKFQQSAQAFYPNDRRFYPLWEKCSELKAPVMFHTGTTGLGAGMPGGMGIHLKYTKPIPYIDDVAADFPNLLIIACHPSWPWQDEMIAVMIHKANVVMELSGWSPKYFSPALKKELHGRLQDRAMFGTDYPMIPHQKLFDAYEAEGYREDILEKIFLKNAQRILGIEI
ncbi:MAG: amidohydrolase [Candidatus Abyssubacteria bacterium]|nr:amidohydrolase [Candidatus Abyssubacteria bacterium]